VGEWVGTAEITGQIAFRVSDDLEDRDPIREGQTDVFLVLVLARQDLPQRR